MRKSKNIFVIKTMVLVMVAVVTITAYFFHKNKQTQDIGRTQGAIEVSIRELDLLKKQIIPQSGFNLGVKWDDLGKQLLAAKVISAEKLEKLYQTKGGLSKEEKMLLSKEDNSEITINQDKAGFLLTLFWALGLGNKNLILENGPMTENGETGNFASTGGWTISEGEAMDHYSKHSLLTLDSKEQELVEKVSKNIYRPCCDNPTYFPDCNHGLAMLGLLELLASQGFNEEQIYKTALKVNSYWFPTTYLTLAEYFSEQETKWEDISPKKILGINYSGASGYQKISSQVTIPALEGGSCNLS